MPNQVANANIVASSNVQAFATAQFHPVLPIEASSSLVPNLTATYKGTTLSILGGSRVFAETTAVWQANASIEGSSTFTTWVIFDSSGVLEGAGSISGVPIRRRFVSGVLEGSGTLEAPPLSGLGIYGSSELTVGTVTANRGVQASILAGASLTARATVQRGVSSAIAGTSYLVPPFTMAPLGILAGSALAGLAVVDRPIASTIVAGSSSSARGTPTRGVASAIAAGSGLSASAQVVRGASATILAGASVSAPIRGHYVAQTHILGSSFFQPPDVAEGVASMVGGSSVSADANVSANIQPNPGVIQTIILGAQMVGAGTLADRLLVSLGGILAGAGAISGDPGLILPAIPLPMVGGGTLSDSIPLPMIGVGVLSGFLQVIRVPRPYCPPRRVKVFRWGYILTRGDLELHVCDTSGNPFGPVVVLYAFYQIVHGGQRMLVGPPNRRPAPDQSEGKPGRFYATGTAGELGQPGEWVVVWRYQRSWWTPTVTFEEHFRVVDEVASCDPWSRQGRHCKYGWT